jgi:hypothetical protein
MHSYQIQKAQMILEEAAHHESLFWMLDDPLS